MDKHNREQWAKAQEGRKVIKDRRRQRVGRPVNGMTGDPVPKDMKRTLYPNRVVEAKLGDDILMPGLNNPKLGGDVLVGHLKGAQIMSLSLEERATCPRSCHHWTTCYGNGSSRQKRWSHKGQFMIALAHDVHRRVQERPLLVRLHQLGDFFSYKYLCLWADMLDRYPDLFVFGFTAWKPGTKIGDGVATLRGVYPDRFAMRHSDMTGEWGCATIDFPTEKKQIGDAVVCPEQLDANRDNPKGKHCGNCAVCWETSKPILFIEHGLKRGRKLGA